jgi:chemotaxis methyl-accepting protein methylase
MLLDESGINGIVEASDIDPQALQIANAGVYTAEAFSEIPSTLYERYVELIRVGNIERHRIRHALRERVRFTRYDLVSSSLAPGAGIFDLVCCRNVLIYLQRDLQERLLWDIHKAIEPGGILCLGEAEWPYTLISSLEPIGQRTHCFRVKEKSSAATTSAPGTTWRHYLAPARTAVETKK